MICSERTFEGECVECTSKNISLCDRHQTCYRDTCVCLDHMCEDDLVCDIEYSATTKCVECRVDDHCEDFQICNDDGECECRDELCGAGTVCSSEDKDGECVECRDENISMCMEFQTCTDENLCGCESEKCPQFLVCDEEGVDGQCTELYICLEDEDCGVAGVCNDAAGNADDADATFAEKALDNTCSCVTADCIALSDGEFDFVCRTELGGVDPRIVSQCLADCDGSGGDYADGVCPEGNVCLPRDRAYRTEVLNSQGLESCFPTDTLCRTEAGVFLDVCPQFMGCVGASAIAGLETSPFCAPICGIELDVTLCEDYPCPVGFEAKITNAEGRCFADDFDGDVEPVCTCVKAVA